MEPGQISKDLIADLQFLHLPDYARYLLENQLEAYGRLSLKVSREMDLPLLRYFAGIPDEQLLAMGRERNRETLEFFMQNRAAEMVENSVKTWTANQLPMIQRDQIVAEDIVLVNFMRRKVFRDLLAGYTNDVTKFTHVMEEVDRFTMRLNITLFNVFLDLKQKELNDVNISLQKRERELLEAQDIGQIGSFEWDLAGKNSSYTPQVFKIFEMEHTNTMESFMDDVHPEDRERLSGAIAKSMTEGTLDCEYRYTRNNKEKVLWCRGKTTFDAGKAVKVVGTIMDVTERNKIVTQLQQSEEQNKQAQALTHIGNWSWDISQNTVTWSDEMYRIYGLKPQSEVISLDRFISFVHPEDKDKRFQEIQESLASLHVKEYHFRIIAHDGSTKVLRGRGEVFADKNKKPLKLVGTCQDITKEFLLNKELKDREVYLDQLNTSLEQKNLELIRTNKELESFNFVASHDLQEPLRKIRIFSDRMLDTGTITLPEPARKYAEKMHAAAGRMQKLIDDFLTFSRTVAGVRKFEPTDLSQMVEDIRTDLAETIEEKKAVIEVSRLPVADTIPFQFRQLLFNLISNSLKYSKQGVKPHVVITSSEVPGHEIKIEGVAPDEHYLLISIADKGIGFEQKYADKIFEMFQRLHSKENYSGTGIGLAICKKIADNHKGFIKAEGIPDEGAVFRIYIPVKQV